MGAGRKGMGKYNIKKKGIWYLLKRRLLSRKRGHFKKRINIPEPIDVKVMTSYST